MRKLAIFSLSLSAAMGICVFLLPRSYMPYAAVLFALLGLTALLFSGDMRLRVILIASGLAAGCLWTWGYGMIFKAPAEALDGQFTEVRAVVSDYPTKTDYGLLVQARVYAEDGKGYKSLIYLTGGETKLLPGDQLSFTAEIRLADTFWNEQTLYYASKGIMLKVSPRSELIISRPEKVSIIFWPAVLCGMIKQKIAAVFPPDTAGFMTALLTGDGGSLGSDLYRNLKTSGIVHAIVISGMHVAFLVGFIQQFARRRRLSAVICIPIILFFMAMVGFTPSVVRAGFMQIILLVAPLLRRENDPPTSLSLALLVILIVNPYALSDVGLQLSFGAMAGITLFSSKIYNYLLEREFSKKLIKILPFTKKEHNPIISAVYSALSATLGAQVFTVPLTVIHFDTLCLASPVTNLLCIWAISLAFPIGVVACTLGLIWTPLGAALGYLAAPLVRYITAVVNTISKIPFASIGAAGVLVRGWVIYAYIMAFIFFLLKGKRKLVPAACCGVTLVVVLFAGGIEQSSLDFAFTAVDVGQGQSIVISSQGHNVIVDCGGTKDPAGAVADYLAAQNSRSADYLILTHYHEDHAGDVAELMTLIDIGCIIMPDIPDDGTCKDEIIEASELYGTELYFLSFDSAFTLGSVTITVFEPLADSGVNEQCITVLAGSEDYSLLITGDMDSEIEKQLISHKSIPKITVLVVGHHGSKYSSCNEFLEIVRPEIAIISCGINSYGHPAQETIERLTAIGAEIYRCDRNGTVTVKR